MGALGGRGVAPQSPLREQSQTEDGVGVKSLDGAYHPLRLRSTGRPGKIAASQN